MHGVTLKEAGVDKDLKGGLVKSLCVRDNWFWSFYESSQLQSSCTGGGGLKKDANWIRTFLIDGINRSNRNGKEVKFSFTLSKPVETFTLIFASETDAMNFNGELVGQSSHQ